MSWLYAAKSTMARSEAHLGECLNQPTMRATSTSTINTPALACPGLGLKRGLSEDIVIAPYATALAAMIDPSAALQNFRRLEGSGRKRRIRIL